MANLEQINSRLAMQSAAFATMGACPVWDAALSRWLRWTVLASADLEFGAMAKADNDAALRSIRMDERHGKGWRNLPHLRPEIDAHMRECEKASDLWTSSYCQLQWEAARALAMTPAPTMAAAVFKAMLIESDEVDNDQAFTADPMALLHADFDRVAP